MTPNKPVELYDRDLVRMLAEVNFINGEVTHLLLLFLTNSVDITKHKSEETHC